MGNIAWASLLLGLALLREGVATGIIEENVTYADGDATLSGYIASPAGAAGKLPAVLHVHAWGGLSDFEKERARRTARELGLVGFAVSVYTEEEATQAQGGMQERITVSQSYSSAPQRFVSRLKAAVAFLGTHTRANASMVAAAGYCFGGTAVLQFAKLGGASEAGVAGVVSFHGGLGGLTGGNASFGSVKVLVANGHADTMIPMGDGSAFQAYMTNAGAHWEFATYGHAMHGFTHPRDDTDHFHYEQVAEERSWTAMADFLSGLGFDTPTPVAPSLDVTNESVTYSDGGVNLTGFVAYPAGAAGAGARLPAIIHVHTWAGLTDFEKHRARRTAAELGLAGFAVSIYTHEEAQKAQGGMQTRIPVAQGYLGAPQRFVSRLSAAVAFLSNHSLVDPERIGATGYCFGGTAVLHYARLGAAAVDGVAGVASFHGGLSGIDAVPQKYCPTRVAIYNGAADSMITDPQIAALADALEESRTYWEFTNYSFANHGFTHPQDGSDHFHFEQSAEQRSWASMADFFNATFDGHGQADPGACVHVSTEASGPGSGPCADDNEAVAAAAGNWGVTSCSSDLCAGQYAEMMRPLCRATCGLCGGDGGDTGDGGDAKDGGNRCAVGPSRLVAGALVGWLTLA